jgi:hypothetical protein
MTDANTKSKWTWHAPLDGDFELAEGSNGTADLEPARAHLFSTLGGSEAWRPAHPESTIRVGFDGWSNARAGTITAWMTPLEGVGSWYPVSTANVGRQGIARLPVVADTYPPRRSDESTLALALYPTPLIGLEARVAQGRRGFLPEDIRGGTKDFVSADHGDAERPRARVLIHDLQLRRGHWYHVGIGWDIDQQRVELYLDGERANVAEGVAFNRPDDALYFGNPMLALADLRATDRLLGSDVVAETYETDRNRLNRRTDPRVEQFLHGSEPASMSVEPEGYDLQTEMDLTDPEEVEQWIPHGPDTTSLKELRATPEGMLVETRDTWDVDNLCTLWGPDRYEGDIHIEYEFRVERDDGLAIVVFDATTYDRGDVIEHRDYPATGSMKTIISNVRNYWWEYFRRTPVARDDASTHLLVKGPHHHPPLGHNVCEIPTPDTWHTMTVNKEGDRIRCAIDDRRVFDVEDSPGTGNGPSYNAGRIGLRHMQKTRVRYRNFRVHTRSPPASVWTSAE